jgi:flagellar motility protein MotE (MotC chaperone)
VGNARSLWRAVVVVWAVAVSSPWVTKAHAAGAAEPGHDKKHDEKGAKQEAKKETKPEAKTETKKEDAKKEDAKKEDAKKQEKKGDNKGATAGKETEAPKAKDTTASKGAADAKEPKDAKDTKDTKDTKEAKKKDGKDAKTEAKSAEKPPSDKEEPTGPITPPIKLATMREEMNRPPRKEEHPISHAEREKLEQLAVEINKAREGLRQDTARLEATLAARDAAQPASSNNNNNAAADGAAETGKKVPTPLDNLAKAMRGMKPEQAAPIISRVDRKLAADVLLRMPAVDAGKVMGVCSPQVAAELTAEIASRQPHAELRR